MDYISSWYFLPTHWAGCVIHDTGTGPLVLAARPALPFEIIGVVPVPRISRAIFRMILVLVGPLVALLAEPVLGVPHRVPAVLLVGGVAHGAVLPVLLQPAPPGLVPSLLRVHLAPDLSTMLDEVRKSHYFEFLWQLLKVTVFVIIRDNLWKSF